jgi:hypothetical protein
LGGDNDTPVKMFVGKPDVLLDAIQPLLIVQRQRTAADNGIERFRNLFMRRRTLTLPTEGDRSG